MFSGGIEIWHWTKMGLSDEIKSVWCIETLIDF